MSCDHHLEFEILQKQRIHLLNLQNFRAICLMVTEILPRHDVSQLRKAKGP